MALIMQRHTQWMSSVILHNCLDMSKNSLLKITYPSISILWQSVFYLNFGLNSPRSLSNAGSANLNLVQAHMSRILLYPERMYLWSSCYKAYQNLTLYWESSQVFFSPMNTMHSSWWSIRPLIWSNPALHPSQLYFFDRLSEWHCCLCDSTSSTDANIMRQMEQVLNDFPSNSEIK